MAMAILRTTTARMDIHTAPLARTILIGGLGITDMGIGLIGISRRLGQGERGPGR